MKGETRTDIEAKNVRHADGRGWRCYRMFAGVERSGYVSFRTAQLPRFRLWSAAGDAAGRAYVGQVRFLTFMRAFITSQQPCVWPRINENGLIDYDKLVMLNRCKAPEEFFF